MAIYKFNTFHWHLTDDQGWRIEIKKYPKLTEIGAWRDSTVENHFSTRPRTYDQKRYGGFYTQEQIKDIVQYAEERYITIVPEIEMPGHARASLAAYPELSCTGKQQGVEGLWGVFDDIFCSKEESILFLQDVLSEVVELFPGEYIHIGGDEAPKTRWKDCQKCQQIIKANGLKDEHELQSYFIKRMDKFLSSKGKKLMGWDEILEGGLSPNAAVMSWRGFEGGLEAAKQKHYVVMSPGSHCYLDHYQGKSNDEPLAIGGFTPLEKVYEFNPVPKEITPDEAAYVLGGQANLWTEYIPNFKQVEYMAYPRAIALSQVLWSSNKPDYSTFLSTLILNHFPLLDQLKVNYSKSVLKPTMKSVRSKNGIELQSKGLVIKNGKLNESTNSFPIIRTKRKIKKVQYVSSTVKDELNPNEEIVTITNHLGLGARIKYFTQPSPKYNESDIILVDGQYGSRPWKGNEWIGFDTDSIVLEIDLGKRTKIKEIELSFLQDEGSWIHTPDMISIQTISPKNGMNAGQGCGPSLDGYSPCPEKWNFDLNSKAEKIRIKIYGIGQIPMGLPGEGNRPWIFMDEITIK
jgi:hexosaminidase